MKWFRLTSRTKAETTIGHRHGKQNPIISVHRILDSSTQCLTSAHTQQENSIQNNYPDAKTPTTQANKRRISTTLSWFTKFLHSVTDPPSNQPLNSEHACKDSNFSGN
ncbi:hypothetical protein VIGAN_01499700 [Vigna angularis var. angularis]|uniref:Uncharacterized protein n=1 Tax=Vigna angularis var. angularis TaxID=157739 RepID=A0A0S3R8Q9_PHAAN|nr:hypothetical protein VIGAN_01499700 [Vigna angularis var. angularis]